MEEVLEEENVTFFAPTNWSIRKSVALLNKMWYQMGNDSIKNLKQIKEKLGLVPGTRMIPFSALTKQGKDDIWNLIELSLSESEDDDSELQEK